MCRVRADVLACFVLNSMCIGYGTGAVHDTERITLLICKARQEPQAAGAAGSVVGASLNGDAIRVLSDYSAFCINPGSNTGVFVLRVGAVQFAGRLRIVAELGYKIGGFI